MLQKLDTSARLRLKIAFVSIIGGKCVRANFRRRSRR
jgi:hypothetical protein